MGRRQYITRMALGRSAFQPGYEVPIQREEVDHNSTGPSHDDEFQRYDTKGNPVNPDIDAFNADMRKAQNEVLSLVGVVERKDHVDQVNEQRLKYIHEHRKELLHDEHERGDTLEYLCIPIRFFCHLWPDAFRQRIQIGFYDPSRTTAEILTSEWTNMWRGGIKLSIATCLPALGDTIAHIGIRVPLLLLAEQLTGRLQNAILRRRHLSRKTRERIYTAMSFFFDALVLAIDIALLPMEFHAFAQRLHLAPPLPFLPRWKSFLPWPSHSYSQDAPNFHNFGWTPLLPHLNFLSSLTSPASLLLIHKMIHSEAEEYDTPIFSLLTKFRYPPINEDHPTSSTPKLRTDPLGCILHTSYTLRQKFLIWSGWKIIKRENPSSQQHRRTNHTHSEQDLDLNLQNNTLRPETSSSSTEICPMTKTHRSTALAHLPAQFLAETIDHFFSRLMTLPFESLMVRTIALAFLRSSSSSFSSSYVSNVARFTEVGGGGGLQAAASRLYLPFGGGPISALFRNPSISTLSLAGQYISRLGLSIALTCAVDSVLFFGVWRSVRYVGMRSFEWGKGGKLSYTGEGRNGEGDMGEEETR